MSCSGKPWEGSGFGQGCVGDGGRDQLSHGGGEAGPRALVPSTCLEKDFEISIRNNFLNAGD